MEIFNGGMMKVKRKELEGVNDDFTDFSLCSPARKIRRLDIELPPIFEEDEADRSMGYEQVIPENDMSDGVETAFKMTDIEELPPSASTNDEKAIVLFKPVNSSLPYSMTSNFTVDPHLISSFKSQGLWGVNVKNARGLNEKDGSMTDEYNGEVNECREVIPWVPSQQLNLGPEMSSGSQPDVSESMDAEEPEVTTMDFEDAGVSNDQPASESYQSTINNEGLHHQWQRQHHCIFPQPPQNTSTPIVWYR